MILHAAVSVLAARADARITTLLRDTGLIRRAVRVHYTFRPAIWRYAYVVFQAGACSLIVDHFAFRVETARAWETGIHRCYRYDCEVKLHDILNDYMNYNQSLVLKYDKLYFLNIQTDKTTILVWCNTVVIYSKIRYRINCLPGCGKHLKKGSPVIPCGQLHSGL